MVSRHIHVPKFLKLVYWSPFLFQDVHWDDRDLGITSHTLCFPLYLQRRCVIAGTAVIHCSLLQGTVCCSGWGCRGCGESFITCSPGDVHGLNFQLYSAGSVLSLLFSSLAHCPSAELTRLTLSYWPMSACCPWGWSQGAHTQGHLDVFCNLVGLGCSTNCRFASLMLTNPGFQLNVVQCFSPPASHSLGSFSVLDMLWEPNKPLMLAVLKCSNVPLYSERVFFWFLSYCCIMHVWFGSLFFLKFPKL